MHECAVVFGPRGEENLAQTLYLFSAISQPPKNSSSSSISDLRTDRTPPRRNTDISAPIRRLPLPRRKKPRTTEAPHSEFWLLTPEFCKDENDWYMTLNTYQTLVWVLPPRARPEGAGCLDRPRGAQSYLSRPYNRAARFFD